MHVIWMFPVLLWKTHMSEVTMPEFTGWLGRDEIRSWVSILAQAPIPQGTDLLPPPPQCFTFSQIRGWGVACTPPCGSRTVRYLDGGRIPHQNSDSSSWRLDHCESAQLCHQKSDGRDGGLCKCMLYECSRYCYLLTLLLCSAFSTVHIVGS